MSKTSELVERYAIDELKSQITEANANPYLGIYGVLLGIIILNVPSIVNAFKEASHVVEWYFVLLFGGMFSVGLSVAFFLVIIQASGFRAREINSFELDQEAYRFSIEERAKFPKNCDSDENSDKIDQQICENIRLRLTKRILEISRKHRKVNSEKAKSQRWAAMSLLLAAMGAFSAFILPIGENPQGRGKPAIATDGEKVR